MLHNTCIEKINGSATLDFFTSWLKLPNKVDVKPFYGTDFLICDHNQWGVTH
jgi:hypothetical protein